MKNKVTATKENTKEISLLNLFNSVQVENKTRKNVDSSLVIEMLNNGYIIEPFITPSRELLKTIESVMGIGGEKLNSSFHKSWKKVSDASYSQLVAEQCLHYLTTYGFEALFGTYDSKFVYIPKEELNVPNAVNLPLVLIKCLTKEEVLNEILKLATSGIALSKETLSDIMVIIKGNDYDSGFVSEVQNRELRSMLFEYYDIVPSEPVSFLRYVIFKLTGDSLLIKNKALIGKIVASDGKTLDKYISQSPKNLAEIFLRYKPLFLAMKKISKNKTFFNDLRRKSVSQHKPLKQDYLLNVTSSMSNGSFKISEFPKEIERYSIWRKIRLAYALKNRLSDLDSVVYRVRNGRGWVTSFSHDIPKVKIEKVLKKTLQSIANDISSNVDGKIFYIPSYVHYALPSSEKQFVGNIPVNSSVSVKDDVIVGVHWYNNDGNDKNNGYAYRYDNGRVDIDFSMIDSDGNKFGWDSRYRNDSRSILFSGDVTDAPKPNGATELFYMKNGDVTNKLLMANYFNHNDGDVVNNFQLFVAHEKYSKEKRSYMVDPNNILISQNVTIDKKQNTIGLIASVDGDNRVFFFSSSIGNSITSSHGKFTDQTRKFLLSTCVNSIDMKDVIELAGGTVIDVLPDDDEIEYVNLSPEALDKTTFIDLFATKE